MEGEFKQPKMEVLFRIVLASNQNLCLSLGTGDTRLNLLLRPILNQNNQKWRLISNSDDSYTIENLYNDGAVTSLNNQINEKLFVNIPRKNEAQERWVLHSLLDGSYAIKGGPQGFVWNVLSNNLQEWELIGLSQYSNGGGDRWKFVSA